MVSQSVIPSKRSLGGSLPYVFTQEGIAMLSSVLRSDQAIAVNIQIMRAFVKLRQWLETHKDLADKLQGLENKYDQQFQAVFDAIRKLMEPPAFGGRLPSDLVELRPVIENACDGGGGGNPAHPKFAKAPSVPDDGVTPSIHPKLLGQLLACPDRVNPKMDIGQELSNGGFTGFQRHFFTLTPKWPVALICESSP